MFTGFKNIAYPEYEVITPQTHLSYTLRTLTVSEEERLKGSLLTPAKIAEHLNKCIYETIVKKPDSIIDYKTFLKNTTIRDREALLYGLYHVTYEEVRNYEIVCSECRKSYQVTAKASQMFNINSYPGEDILTRKVMIQLPISQSVNAYIKQATIEDEEIAIKNLSSYPGFTLDSIVGTLFIDRFEQDIEVSKEPLVYSDRKDIIDAYNSLPAKDRRTIFEKYNEEFGKYGVDLKMQVFCTNCSHQEVVDVNLVDNFFRMVQSS